MPQSKQKAKNSDLVSWVVLAAGLVREKLSDEVTLEPMQKSRREGGGQRERAKP